MMVPSPAADPVLKFYRDLPFNYSSTPQFEAAELKRSNLIKAAYPFLEPWLRPTTRVLDVGCGVGTMAHSMAYFYGSEVTALDFNPVVIARAREIGQLLETRVNFVTHDLFSFTPGIKYELVTSQGVLHHTDDCPGAVRKVIRDFTQPGGHICIGLYHKFGRKPFLEHFAELTARGRAEEELIEEFRRLNVNAGRNISDEVFLKSWFRDQVLHPRESQHTLAEFMDLLREERCELLASSVNQFKPFNDLEELAAAERLLEKTGRERLAAGKYYPGFFVFLARRQRD